MNVRLMSDLRVSEGSIESVSVGGPRGRLRRSVIDGGDDRTKTAVFRSLGFGALWESEEGQPESAKRLRSAVCKSKVP